MSTTEQHTPTAILVRVSTTRQETDRQITALRSEAEKRGWTVTEVIEEQISGRAENRQSIERITHLVETRQIKKLMIHEISRLSRRPEVIVNLVEAMTKAGVSLYWHNMNLETLNPNGTRNQTTGLVLAIFGELARTEAETIAERVKSGMEEARRKGKHLGRPHGTTTSTAELLAKHEDVVRLFKAGKSYRDIAARTGKSLSTVQRVVGLVRL